ncbi:nucleotidyl transferase AbiEii/AbiGii toxin family protein [Xenorhabdus sp. XENO-7]|uniref:Nucleotidyl transferase AbiEii/AbiGii toxin family protein n=1 Tax=Xenorhabdus aichiensis TaxID=3025874 RepID=A0ABT5M6Q2_9GAMM|nr:nucleotidyl transferase AbiEii/AbiGii toxin family protein [Xenorhabdus aichiensis]MDC9623151.1 nucleotidyl transferase AbiEii/AbiGii toxin family protein [Xenorhabdus aichiensis]
MKKLKDQFLEVSDALELGNPAIIEKDYWVVALLAELAKLAFDTHQMVFSGGTALAKSNVKILRMSEDVDIKLIPTDAFNSFGRDKRKATRKALVQQIEKSLTHQSSHFSIKEKKARDEYRYVEYELKYPQQFRQAPCLRPIIKLELMETIPLLQIEQRSIQSLVAELYHQPHEVNAFSCISVQSTLVEKVISMLRRTMLVKRDFERKDDATLIRHIYDVHCIDAEQKLDFETLMPLFQTVLQEDVMRFGNQHAEFVANPVQELQLGLQELESNPLFIQRFTDFVTPMVFDTETPDFDTCFASFKRIAQSLMNSN